MKKKLLLLILPLLAGGGFAASKMAAAEPPPPKPKVHGHVYVLPREFVINLAEERLVRLMVGLLLDPAKAAHAAAPEGEAAKPPEGFGPDPQEALIREIVVDTLTGESARKFATARGRQALKDRILEQLQTNTDVPATHVLFTDLAVQ